MNLARKRRVWANSARPMCDARRAIRGRVDAPHSSMPPTTTRWIARARVAGTSTIARAWSKKDDDEIWDEDERRRVEENKRWRRTDDPSEAWDIDKERDALMYKRESLEALLRVEYEPEEGRGEAKDDDDDDASA